MGKIIEYGKPKGGEKNYIGEFYCAVCNQIPYICYLNIEGGEEQLKIDSLNAVPVMKMYKKEGLQEVQVMLCRTCLYKIGNNLFGEMKKRFEGLGGEGGV